MNPLILRLQRTRIWSAWVWFSQVTLYQLSRLASSISPVGPQATSWFVVSLCNSDRRAWVTTLQKQMPCLQIWKAIDGYRPQDTMAAFRRSGLAFRRWPDPEGYSFFRYGKLACFLSRYFLLRHQVDSKIPFMVILEDDLLIEASFPAFVSNAINLLRIFPHLNIVRLGPWGECYITSLRGATRIIQLIQNKGIVNHSDVQLRTECGPELSLHRIAPFTNLVAANHGDITKTPLISSDDIGVLLASCS